MRGTKIPLLSIVHMLCYTAAKISALCHLGQHLPPCSRIKGMSDIGSPMLSIDPVGQASRQIYKLMTGIIVPRPIALVSTVDADGAANVAPFSFFNGVGSVPPTLIFCPALHGKDVDPVQRKDTLANV